MGTTSLAITKPPISNKALLKRCAGYFAPHKHIIAFACLAMVLAGLCNAGSAWLVKPALDKIFIEKDPDALFFVPLFFVGITFGKVSTRLLQNYLMQYSGLKVLEVLRDELYNKIIMLPMKFFEGSQVGTLMSRIINDVVVIRSSMPAIVMMVRQVVTLISLAGVVFYQNFELAIWALVVLPLVFFPFVYFGRRIRNLGRKNQAKLADISTVLQEILSGIRVVKAFGTEQQETQRFDKENKRLLRIVLKQCLASEFSSSSMELIGSIGIGLVIWFGGLQVIEGHSTPGTFFSFITALVMMYEPVKKMSNANNDLQKALAGAERVFEILDSPDIKIEKQGKKVLSEPFDSLQFDKVSFAYDDGTLALCDINFTVKRGERVAIVGPSGAGKSTFVNLIPRFYDPDDGCIYLNGIPLQDYSLHSLRHTISLVSQDNFLFNLPVDENITYGDIDVSEEKVVEAAKAAYAHDFIMSLPEGYKTVIGERGVKLSGGQKQRLTIARALIKDAPLLILDEATSALDSESERIVQKALDNLMQNRTSIVIAHRLSTVMNADRIIVMEQGRIVAVGNHAELITHSPLYAKLYSMQFNVSEMEQKLKEMI